MFLAEKDNIFSAVLSIGGSMTILDRFLKWITNHFCLKDNIFSAVLFVENFPVYFCVSAEEMLLLQ